MILSEYSKEEFKAKLDALTPYVSLEAKHDFISIKIAISSMFETQIYLEDMVRTYYDTQILMISEFRRISITSQGEVQKFSLFLSELFIFNQQYVKETKLFKLRGAI